MHIIPQRNLHFNDFFQKKIAEHRAQRLHHIKKITDHLTCANAEHAEVKRWQRWLNPYQQRHMIVQQYWHEKMYERILKLEDN